MIVGPRIQFPSRTPSKARGLSLGRGQVSSRGEKVLHPPEQRAFDALGKARDLREGSGTNFNGRVAGPLLPVEMVLCPPPHVWESLGGAVVVVCGFTVCFRDILARIAAPARHEPPYERAGEHGECEVAYKGSSLKEPLNAWTSLSFSVFGLAICCMGALDAYEGSRTEKGMPPLNRLAREWGFSLIYGAAFVYLGIASFLFHASHSERWRKADAAMAAGALIPALVRPTDLTITPGQTLLINPSPPFRCSASTIERRCPACPPGSCWPLESS
jgi:hypothetical protein